MGTATTAHDVQVSTPPMPPEFRSDVSRVASFAVLLSLIGFTLLAILIVLPYRAVFDAMRALPRPFIVAVVGDVLVITACLLLQLACGIQAWLGAVNRPAADAALALRHIRALLMICLALGLPTCLLGFVAAGDPWVAVWPLSTLAFGIACGCLLNLVRSTLHRIEPPKPRRASRGFVVVLKNAPALAADAPAPTATTAGPPTAGSVDAEEALSTVLHVLAGLGVLVYGFRLWPLVLLGADLAAGRFGSLASMGGRGHGFWAAAMIFLAFAAGLCAFYWVLWGITCVGTGARWYRTTLAFAWLTNLISAIRLLICMLMAMQGTPYWLRDMLAASLENPHLRGLSLWAGVADLAFPIAMLVLVTRVPVRALFREYQWQAWDPNQ